MQPVKLLFALFILFATVAMTSPAQTVNPYEGYEKPFGSFIDSKIDSINTITGNLSLRIPLVSYPQRGDDLKLNYVLGYNHIGWTSIYECFITTCKYIWTGVGVTSPNVYEEQLMQGPGRQQLPCLSSSCSRGTSVFLYTARRGDGTVHEMADLGNGNVRSVDASALYGVYVLNGISTLIEPTGVRHYSGGTVSSSWQVMREDRNGNQIFYSTAGWLDTMGRIIPAAVATSDYSGCTGPLPVSSASVVNYPGISGGVMPIKFCVATISLLTNFKIGCGLTCNVQFSGTTGFLQSIVLPNGTAYTFEYSSRDPGDPSNVNYGDLTKITLPSGGTISYVWGPIGACSDITYQRRAVISRTVDANDGTGPHQWSYHLGYGGTITDPLGNDTVYTAFGPTCSGYVSTAKQYQGSQSTGALLKTVATTYSYSSNPLAQYENAPALVNVVPTQITTTWANGQVSQVQKSYNDPGFYDSYGFKYIYGKLTAEQNYDYGSNAPGPLLRNTVTSYLAFTNQAYLNNNLLNLISSVRNLDANSVQKSLVNYNYDEGALDPSGVTAQHDSSPPNGAARGNLTSVSRWLNTTGAYLNSTMTFYDTGMPHIATDPNGHSTTYAYSTSYAGALPTTVTNALNQITTHAYDMNSGLRTSTTDPNNLTTTFSYDNMWRLVQTNTSDGGQITQCYTDEGGATCSTTSAPFQKVTTRKINGTQNLITTVKLDGLARPAQTKINSDPQGLTYGRTEYDALGRQSLGWNPTRCDLTVDPPPTNCSGESTFGKAELQYDTLGRVTKVIPPDGTASANNVTTVYAGNCTTVTDQSGKKRKSCMDALGRLFQVFEPDSAGNFVYETDYQYDVLDNLTRVDQKGNDANSANWRTRTFTYNSLSQLLTATNPESVTTSYTYDADGNLITKTAPAPNQAGAATATTTYVYDALHRLTQKSYSDGTTPAVKYGYDGVVLTGCAVAPPALTITNGIGRRTSMCDAAGSEAWSYDSMGRVLTDRRTTNGITKDTLYSYNLDGSVATITNPSGRVITYTYNAAARPVSAVDSINGVNYATGASYAPQGALASLTLGTTGTFTGISLNQAYNSRLQPTTVRAWSTNAATPVALDLAYGFNLGTANNGNVASITNNRDNTRSQNFTYDALNRIATAQTQTAGVTIPNVNCWGLTFGYDAWGNLLTQTNSGPSGCSGPLPLNVTVNTKNQILTNNVVSLANYCYDEAGNLIHTTTSTCPTTGPYQYTYNAENQLVATAGVTYTYDGDGKRVMKSSGTIYWYGSGSDPLAETDLSGSGSNSSFHEYVFFGGKRIARRDYQNNVNYYFADHLGTARVVTSASGTILDDSDFYPFGGERPVVSSSGNTYKFTGKERDSESGLDNFGARYDSSTLGRFMSPDPSMDSVRFRIPQSWNRYSYTINNPLRFIDPDGELWVASGNTNDPYTWVDSCGQNQTCYDAVGAVVGNSLRLYGSNNAQDITNIQANQYGMVDLNDINQQHDAAFDVNTRTDYSYVNLQTGADFFNFVQDYQSNYPDAPNLYVTEAGADDGSNVPGHLTHRDGKQIDLRYVDDDGNPIQNPEAYNKASADRMWDIFRMVHNAGMTQIYAGDESEWGDSARRPSPPADPHETHFHISIPNPQPRRP